MKHDTYTMPTDTKFVSEKIKEINRLIINQSQKKSYKKGEAIENLGQRGIHSYYVLSGILKIYTITSSGVELVLDFATEDTFIKLYERSTICETNTSAIQAIEDCEVYLIDFELIKTMMAKESEYMNYIFRLNRLELQQQQHRIALLLHSRASERYLHFRELYKSIANRIRSTEIASYIGVTKENLSRIKSQL